MPLSWHDLLDVRQRCEALAPLLEAREDLAPAVPLALACARDVPVLLDHLHHVGDQLSACHVLLLEVLRSPRPVGGGIAEKARALLLEHGVLRPRPVSAGEDTVPPEAA